LEVLNYQWAYWGIEVVQNSVNHHPTIRYNKSHHNSKGGKISCGDGGGINIRADNAEVYYNLCYANDGPGIGGDNMSEPVHYRSKIYNNVSYNNCQAAYMGCNELKLGAGVADFVVQNNILQRDPASIAYYFVSISDSSTFLRNNCYFSPDPNEYRFSWGAQEISGCENWFHATGDSKTSFCDDPQFAYAQSFDFRLRFNSQCIDKGTYVGLREDGEGVPVPYKSWPDIGAHEYYGDDYDGIPHAQDNCPGIPNGPGLGTCINMNFPFFFGKACIADRECGTAGFCSTNQDDRIPNISEGNGYGDACDCYGNFDNDFDVDGIDAAKIKASYGRSRMLNPCTNETPCSGDFNVDEDVDGSDVFLFRANFGRNSFNNPCPLLME
jgi:hypothetical protein